MAEAHIAPGLRLFDCFCSVGRSTKPSLQPSLTVEDLLEAMDRIGVDEALVSSAAIEIASPVDTNPAIADLCSAHDRLHPVWQLLPPQTGEMLPERLPAEMKEHGVKALLARPDIHGYQLNSITMGALFEVMLTHKIPLFLNSDWRLITDVLRDFPQLRIIATSLGCWGVDRQIRPLLEHFENFHIETSSVELDGCIPALVEEYGATRILFGTGFPWHAVGGSALMLRNLDISPGDKELIAHGNLEGLLNEVTL